MNTKDNENIKKRIENIAKSFGVHNIIVRTFGLETLANLENNSNKKEEIILEQFINNGTVYYKNNIGAIFNEKYELVGSIREYKDDNTPICEFFERKRIVYHIPGSVHIHEC